MCYTRPWSYGLSFSLTCFILLFSFFVFWFLQRIRMLKSREIRISLDVKSEKEKKKKIPMNLFKKQTESLKTNLWLLKGKEEVGKPGIWD